MNVLRVEVRPGACCGFGNCATVCPEVFVFDGNRHRLNHVENELVAAHVEHVVRAVNECPAQALVLVRSPGGAKA